MKNQFIRLALLISASAFVSCGGSERAAHSGVIAEWVGREIALPDELVYQIKDDTISLDLDLPDFKIVSYVDSSGCTSCRMKLRQWSELIDELKSLPDVDVEVIMIVNSTDPKEITYLLQHDNYLNPVAIDRGNLFDSLNDLPPRSAHHTFLLDAENKVIALGNPVTNPKIKDIFLQLITDGVDATYSNEMCREPVQPIGVVHPGDTVRKLFYINNLDKTDFSLQAIVPSCDCISASAEFTNLSAGEINKKITVSYVADTVPVYFNRYVDIFFKEKELPERLTVYGYIKYFY